jgi:hypothetical protein
MLTAGRFFWRSIYEKKPLLLDAPPLARGMVTRPQQISPAKASTQDERASASGAPLSRAPRSRRWPGAAAVGASLEHNPLNADRGRAFHRVRDVVA